MVVEESLILVLYLDFMVDQLPLITASKAGLHSITQEFSDMEQNIISLLKYLAIIETDLTEEELKSGGGGLVVNLTLLKKQCRKRCCINCINACIR